MKKIIITGSSGLLGQYLHYYFSQNYDILGIYHSHRPENLGAKVLQADLSEIKACQSIIESNNPDFIINTAALASVDECEEKPQLAEKLNTQITENISKVLKGSKTKFIHLSTDQLFSGTQSFYTEDSEIEPLNIYALSKAHAEKKALEHLNSIVIRTNFYGGHTISKPSFSTWIYRELKNGKTINLIDDTFYTPISVHALSRNIELLMKSELTGIYNVAGCERLSKYAFGMNLAEKFDLNSKLINKSKLHEIKLKAKRPQDMSLSIEKIKRDLKGAVIENVEDGLKAIKELNLI